MGQVIRQVTIDDLDAVLRFDATDDKTAFSQKKGGDFIAGLILSGSAFVAFVDNVPAAYARIDYLWPERVPLLSWLFVVTEHRGTGLADSMRQHVFDHVAKMGYEAMLRSACTERPHMIDALNKTCLPAGSLTFLNGTVEQFFWHRLR